MALVDDDLAAALALKDTVDTFITKIEAVLASGGTDQAKLQQIADALAATKADVDAASARDLPPEG